MAGKIYNPTYPGLYYFDTFTFTTLGTSGHRGPDSTKRYVNAPWGDGDFSIVDGQQLWTVPATGTYLIEAAGAYGATPGRVVSGEVNLSQDQVISMLVGQLPSPFGTGGGGGTFVTSNGKPLIVASGGDGTGGHAGSFLPSGAGTGGSGAGYYGNGSQTNSILPFLVPNAYVNGGFGNSNAYTYSEGGFGGGQCPYGIGGGGYTGSPGDGVSGATCYADASVTNFTDLGATSNTAGYVTISLIDPVPVNQTWSWDPTKQWTITNAVASGLGTPVWSSSLGLFIVSADFTQIVTSPDGVIWSAVQTNLPTLPLYNDYYGIVESTTGVLLAISSDTGYVYRSLDAVSWTLSLSVDIDATRIFFVNGLFILVASDNTNVYTSPDGLTWTTITPNVIFTSITYGSSKYVMTTPVGDMYSSTNLTTWSSIADSNVSTSIKGWSSVLCDNQTFVALKKRLATQLYFYTQNSVMSPKPQIMINNPIYNITSLTFTTGYWGNNNQAKIGDIVTFSSITNFGYTISPATYGTVTAVNSGSVTLSITSSTISVKFSAQDYISLQFTRTGTDYTIVTSSDGINWYGRTTPSNDWTTLISGGDVFIALNYFGIYLGGNQMYSTDKGATWAITGGTAKGLTSGVYSPTLNYFLFTNRDIFYVSLDGSIIVPAISGGTVGHPIGAVWADTLGLFVVVTSYSIITSSDGTNWILVLNLKPDGFGGEYGNATISWSRDLGLLVAYFCNANTNNSPLIYTSTDGITWSQTVLAQSFTSDGYYCGTPCWSPQLGIFTNGEAISHDGIHWSFGSGPFLTCVAWSPELKLFVGSGIYNSFYSSDGISWSTVGNQIMRSIAWSPTLKLFVGVGEQSQSQTPFLIYTSSTGQSWTQVYSDAASSSYAYGGAVVWSPELSIFVCAYRYYSSGTGIRMFTSSDGVSWIARGSNIIQSESNGVLVWSPDIGIFLFTAYGQPGMFISPSASNTF